MKQPNTRKEVKQQEQQEESWGKWWLQTFAMALVFVGIVTLMFTFVLANDQVSGPSMQPTFEGNDRVIALRHDHIDRGDVVILQAPDEAGVLYIKRVIGLPGETVASKNDVMYINGKKYAEPFLNNSLKKQANLAGDLYTENFTLQSKGLGKKVPKDSYFVMGDHRPVSKDGRSFGYVKRSAIVGVVKLRYWPLNRLKWF
ncbi:signal peptidase I [Schleiferilactobacillus shenzhenensis]|uniref:Signal peptidase I n=1 Tax=Schleiferilactobacillus shenzhenensis LY-73 TaxID=1231336 RepID=U4TRR7_9LACO|nr:signal peptidase I [Schleiferilactobacillus shenzhenensis]ERL66150.1 LepB [Schleiferilactobacillus shenzhenensis LY-73]